MSSLLSRISALLLPAARPAAEGSPRRHFERGDRAPVPSGEAPECRWCGNDHDVSELCRPRRVSRRSFLFTASAAAAGALVAPACPALEIVDTGWLNELGNLEGQMALMNDGTYRHLYLQAMLRGQQWRYNTDTGEWGS